MREQRRVALATVLLVAGALTLQGCVGELVDVPDAVEDQTQQQDMPSEDTAQVDQKEDEDGEELPEMCGYDCTITPMGAEDARCMSDRTTICELFCRPDITGDCDGDMQNGCETSLADNDDHCGACDNSCTAGDDNTVSACVDLSCEQSSCADGWYDMNDDLSDGCEVHIDLSGAEEVETVAAPIEQIDRLRNYTAIGYRSGTNVTLRLYGPGGPIATTTQLNVPDLTLNHLRIDQLGDAGIAVLSSQSDYVVYDFADDLSDIDILDSGRTQQTGVHEVFLDSGDQGFGRGLMISGGATGTGVLEQRLYSTSGCEPTSTGYGRCLIGNEIPLDGLLRRVLALRNRAQSFNEFTAVALLRTPPRLTYAKVSLGDTRRIGALPSSDPLEAYTSMVEWVNADGDALGFVGFNGTDEIHIQRINIPDTQVQRTLAKSIELPVTVGSGGLVRLPDERFLLVTPGQIFLFSAKPTEPALHTIDVAPLGMLMPTGGFGDSLLALASDTTLYHLPLEFFSP